MTDKEIIIDGVDVSECVEFRDDVYTDKQINNACSIGLWQRHYSGLEENCKMSCECKNNSDCYFKQLKRKEQECEELKDKNQYLINTYCHFKNEIKKYKKAVHKYKVVFQDKIKRLHLSRREFLKEINSIPIRIACNGEDFKNALNNFNNAIQVINNEDRYKQALDEIEEFCTVYSNNHDAYETVYKFILAIINKAKE